MIESIDWSKISVLGWDCTGEVVIIIERCWGSIFYIFKYITKQQWINKYKLYWASTSDLSNSAFNFSMWKIVLHDLLQHGQPVISNVIFPFLLFFCFGHILHILPRFLFVFEQVLGANPKKVSLVIVILNMLYLLISHILQPQKDILIDVELTLRKQIFVVKFLKLFLNLLIGYYLPWEHLFN